MAVYMIAQSLELTLKAAICKHNNLAQYPEGSDNRTFLTHNFDRLFSYSGLSKIISTSGETAVFATWSAITNPSGIFDGKEYINFRYDLVWQSKITSLEAQQLLYDLDVIHKVMTKGRKW